MFSAHINVPFSFTDSVGAQAKHSTAAAMKVLPFGDDRSVLVNGETQTAPEDLLQELQIARALSEGHGRASFIQFHGYAFAWVAG